MTYSSQLKLSLWEKTEQSLHAPQKKNRIHPCCAHSFCLAADLFSSPQQTRNPLLRELNNAAKEGTCEECDSHFIRSAFLHAGSMTDPEKRYHLEVLFPSAQGSKLLEDKLQAKGIPFKTVTRKGKELFYLKDSEIIEDFLTLIGAQGKALELMQTKVEKDVKNQINRINNSDNANLQRTVYFAGRVADAITLLKQHDMFERLPENLKKTAALRRKYPGASLSELCLYSEEHITKSGLNHRLQKIIEEAEKLEESIKNKEDTP